MSPTGSRTGLPMADSISLSVMFIIHYHLLYGRKCQVDLLVIPSRFRENILFSACT
jgi:hypothetical protein